MQEVFENLAILIVEKDPYISNILNLIQENKRDKKIKSLRKSDADSIFQAIESDNPFTKSNIE